MSRQLGFNHSEEARKNMSLSAKARGLRGPNVGKHLSDSHKAKIGAANKGRDLSYLKKYDENHPQWKGNNVKYRALHMWVERRLGKPEKCQHCGTTTAKKFEWANKSHQYLRDLADWIRLCTSCHRKYDHNLIIEN